MRQARVSASRSSVTLQARAKNQLDQRLVHIGCQQATELAPGCRMPVTQQHMYLLAQSDMRGVERSGSRLVIGVVGIGSDRT